MVQGTGTSEHGTSLGGTLVPDVVWTKVYYTVGAHRTS